MSECTEAERALITVVLEVWSSCGGMVSRNAGLNNAIGAVLEERRDPAAMARAKQVFFAHQDATKAAYEALKAAGLAFGDKHTQDWEREWDAQQEARPPAAEPREEAPEP